MNDIKHIDQELKNQDLILEISILYDDLPDLKHYKYNYYPTVPIGGKNPYYKCAHCGVSDLNF